MADYSEAIFYCENQNSVTIQCRRDEKMGSIFQKFFTKAEYERDKYIFTCNGKLINKEITFGELINNENNNIINVQEKEKINAFLLFNIFLFQQFNSLNNIPESQNNINFNNNTLTNLNNINIINNNKDGISLFNEECVEKANDIIKIFKEHQFCAEHRDEQYKEPFLYYCMQCKKDLCSFCENEHKDLGHNLIKYSNFIKKEDLNEKIKNRKKDLNIILGKIDEAIKALNNLKDKYKFDYEISKEIVDNYNVHNRNYQILNTIKKIYDYETIFDDVQKNFIFQKYNQEVWNISSNIAIKKYNNFNNIMNNDYNFNNSINNVFITFMKSYLIQYNIMLNNLLSQDFENFKEQTQNSFVSQIEQFKDCNIKNSKDISKSVKNHYKNDEKNFRKDNKKINGEISLNSNEMKNNSDNSLNQIKNVDSQKNNLEDKNNEIIEIIINYRVSDKDKENGYVKIFGKQFIENNNSNNCYFIYNEKKYFLSEFLELNKNEETDIIEIRLVGINKITNPSYMFHECSSLYSILNFDKYITTNVTDISYMFYECSSLESLNGISEWDTKNVKDMKYMFYGCKSLSFLPDISKWKTTNVSLMSYMFSNCLLLQKLPDLSKWNMDNVIDMRGMFCNCEKLQYLPEISKWNMENVHNISFLFSGCKSLRHLPDISIWKLSNLKSLENVFNNCILLTDLPDISKWDISNVKKMNSLFEGCQALKMLPDISQWKTHNVTDISGLFKDCISLEEISDISEWNTDNIKNMSNLFRGCGNLLEVPDISKWNFSKAKDISYLFDNCINLYNFEKFSKFNIENKRINGRFILGPEYLVNLFET